MRAIDATATSLSAHAPAASFVTDADRREELIRTLLAVLEHRPANESPEQAQDRLAGVSILIFFVVRNEADHAGRGIAAEIPVAVRVAGKNMAFGGAGTPDTRSAGA